ncbi:MAG: hypothetical protein PHO64_13270 [Thiomonas sp.]|nr:hypothetical protein [Thiomonas sp.]
MKKILLAALLLTAATAARAAPANDVQLPTGTNYPLAEAVVAPIATIYKMYCQQSGGAWEQVPGKVAWNCKGVKDGTLAAGAMSDPGDRDHADLRLLYGKYQIDVHADLTKTWNHVTKTWDRETQQGAAK